MIDPERQGSNFIKWKTNNKVKLLKMRGDYLKYLLIVK